MLEHCKQAVNIEVARFAVEILNEELPKPQEERDPFAVQASLASLGGLKNPQYKLNEDKTRIEYCSFDCDSCHSAVKIEDSDPLLVISVPIDCPDSPSNGEIRVIEL